MRCCVSPSWPQWHATLIYKSANIFYIFSEMITKQMECIVGLWDHNNMPYQEDWTEGWIACFFLHDTFLLLFVKIKIYESRKSLRYASPGCNRFDLDTLITNQLTNKSIAFLCHYLSFCLSSLPLSNYLFLSESYLCHSSSLLLVLYFDLLPCSFSFTLLFAFISSLPPFFYIYPCLSFYPSLLAFFFSPFFLNLYPSVH